MIANASKLKGKLQENVMNFAGQAILSKQLATIHCEVPVKWNEDDLSISEPDKEILGEIFSELEFRTLANRVLGENSSPSPTLSLTDSTMQKETELRHEMDEKSNEVFVEIEHPKKQEEEKTMEMHKERSTS